MSESISPRYPKVIFLDIDGVLNGHKKMPNGYCTIATAHIQRLNRVLVQTQAKIVISSAWRYLVSGGSMTLKGFEYLLRTHGLTAENEPVIVGITPTDEEIPTRGAQIQSVLDRPEFQGCRFAIVDNLSFGGRLSAMFGDRFVKTKSSVGLNSMDAALLVRILGDV